MSEKVYLLQRATKNSISGEQNCEISDEARRKMALAEPLSEADKQSLNVRMEIWDQGREGQAAPDNISTPGIYTIISQDFKDAVEDLEPGLHEFVPLQVVWRNTGECAGSYFWFLCTEIVDHYNIDKTEWLAPSENKFGAVAAEQSRFRPTFRNSKSVVVHSDRVAGKHLWRASVPRMRPLFCSEDFAAFLKTRKRTGVELVPVTVL